MSFESLSWRVLLTWALLGRPGSSALEGGPTLGIVWCSLSTFEPRSRLVSNVVFNSNDASIQRRGQHEMSAYLPAKGAAMVVIVIITLFLFFCDLMSGGVGGGGYHPTHLVVST